MKRLFLTLTACLFIAQAYTQNALDYDWKNVKIGGGGYITGIKVHPQDPDIMYLRTDVGGAYRWNAATQEVEQIINFRNGNYYGVAGIALHPTNKNIVYLAVDRNNTASQSAILKSTNRGDTWQVISTGNTGIKFGANGGRNNSDTEDRDREGSPIAVNPNDANELWVGSREKGLWRLNGTSWTRIAAGTMPDNNLENSIRNVIFHPTNPNYIYVGYYNYGIYRSSNGGASFSQINGGNNNLKDVSDLSFSKNGTKLYAACRNKGVYRLNTPLTNTNWTNTNISDAGVNYGYLTVTASPHNDNIVVACPAGTGGNNFERLHVSYDSGNTWTKKNNTTSVTIYNWNQNNGKGLHTAQLAFDPNDPNKLYFTAWSGLWHTSNWQANQVAWNNTMAYGHEEIVNTGLTAFPPNNNGTVVGVNSADHAGWVVTDPDNYPSEDIKDLVSPSGSYIKGAGTAICEQYPANIVVSSTKNWADSDGYILYSTDAGQSFSRANGYSTAWGKANVAIAQRNPNNIVVVCSAGVKYSTDRGATFNNASGISGVSAANSVFFAHRPLVADAVRNNTFYIYNRSNGKVFRSTNNGQNWSERGTVPFTLSNESNSTRLTAVPGREGHLFINHFNNGLYRSTNGGTSWTKVSSVSKAVAISIGKEKTAGDYPTIYMLGRLTGQNESWIYRSTDQGVTWEQISDESTLFLEARIRHMAADRSEFGKVYVSASGLGVWSGSADATPPPPAEFIDITGPTQGESIPKGSIYDITWNDNLPGSVRVVLFKEGNYDRTLASSVPSNGIYAWTLTNDIPAGNNYQIRVRSNDNGDIDDYSENFSITNPCPAAGTACNDGDANTVNDVEDGNCNCEGSPAYIVIYTQADGNDVEKGSTQNILWGTNLSGDMRVVLFKDGNYDRTIASAASNNYQWTVVNDIPAGDNYTIRVRSNVNPDIDAFTQAFSIVEPATLDCDLIPNSTFQNGDLSGWTFKQNGGASGTYSSPWNRAQLSINNAGTAIWHLSLQHDDITLKGGKTYQLQYEAKAWGNREMSVFVQHKNNNYATLYSAVVSLQNAWNPRPTATFTMPSDGEVVVSFRVGTNATTVILDNITLNEVGCPAAKKDESYSPDIQLFPNPATHTIHLNTELFDYTQADVLVYDAFGKMVKNITGIELAAGAQTLDVDVSDLSAGMYFCTLQSNDWQAVERFIIIR